uniref:GEVED domain-containing protein n=1 Tax=Lutibacter sp. TaxID=1925666 RepID=UPI003568D6B8
MKTISNILKINLLLVLCVLYSVSALSQSSDFFVQHIQDDVPRTGANNTSFTPVSSLNNAVSLANNNRKTHAGRSDLNPANLNGDDMAGARSLTAVGTLTYYREGASINTDMRFNTSIWEYIGPVGGCNEMIVRGRYVVNLNGTTNSVTQALSGVLNANKCIPFITGIMNNDSSSGADSGTALAYLENATTLRVQKGTTSNNVSVYITVVEFTGSNWTVLHGDSGNTSGDSGTMTLRSGSDGTGTATSVSSWNEAMIFSHFRGDTSTSGTNQAISDLWPISDPGSNNQSVDWNFDGAHDSGGTNRHFVHVLNNPYLSVTRFQDTNNSDSNTNINIASAGLSNFNEALIIGSSVSSGGGTAYGRGWRNYYLNSITQAAHWAHRSGNSMAHEIQIIDLSGLTSQDINVVDSSSNAINDGSGNSPSVINDTEYGNVEIATSLAKTYTIENNGSCDLTISSITSSNAEFVVSSVPVTISGGGSGTFIITYNPSSIGINSATITINSNDPDSTEQIYTFTVQGTGEYCSSNGNNTSEEYIQNVQLNTINNTSGAGTTSTGYSNFTAQSTDLSLNSNYTITITPFWTGTIYDEAYSVWIDYNGDGDFSDAGEQVWTQSATTTTPVLGSFTIPITATLGSTRMRVSMKWNGIPTTCESFTYGEVEDYTVNIIGCITNTWTGTISADWNNTLNWSCGTIPTITTDVLIPTGVTNYPEIYSTDAAGLANNIELETGTSLIVYDNYIQIAGNLLLNGFIDLDGEGQLIQNTGSTLDNASTGYIEID